MFRLVKVISGNNQYEVSKLALHPAANFGCGCALTCTNGLANNASAAVMPDYISLTSTADAVGDRVEAMIVNEDMIFKVEFVGTTSPLVGMTVGLSTLRDKMDAVTYSSSGKGKIVAIDEDPSYVYVKFRK